MPDQTAGILTLRPGGGWLRDGDPWRAADLLYAVLGDPIDHSRSPAMHTAAMQERGLAGQYWPVRIRDRAELAALKRWGAASGLAGFNVTAPLKEAARELCDALTPTALTLGVVNTVRTDQGRWLGHNTDSGGILAVLTQAWSADQPPAVGTVLGGGGAGRAAVHALARWGVARIFLQTRSSSRRQSLHAWLGGHPFAEIEPRIEIQPLPSSPQGVRAPKAPAVWVVCLPPAVSAKAYLPDAAISGDCLLLDLRYGDGAAEDPALLGCTCHSGEPVLLMQGGLAFAWWFGPPVPWTAMRRALDG